MSPAFIAEVRLILKSKAHSDCEQAIIDAIYQSTMDEIVQVGNTKKIGGTEDTPFVRKRLEGMGTGSSGGYRLYLWAFKVNDDIHLLFIHPKKGRRSSTNLSKKGQRLVVADFKKFRAANTMVLTRLSNCQTQILQDDTGAHLFP